MKKILVVVLLIILALSLTLAACKTDEVNIEAENLKLVKGTPVNWNDYVTITVKGKKVESPVITWKIIDGDPSKVGTCKYEITYLHNEKYYTREAFVTFTSGVVISVPNKATFKIGEEINWNSLVSVYIDDVIQQNPTLKATCIGNPNVEGDCLYEISFEYEGKTYSERCTIHYDEHARMVATKDIIDAYIGDEINWNSLVEVYIDGVLQVNPKLKATLKDGDPEEEGVCEYVVAYEYGSKEITLQIKIRYSARPDSPKDKEVRVVLLQNAFKVGDKIDWQQTVVVYVDGMIEKNFEISAALNSGNPANEGACEYTLTVTVEGIEPKPYRCTITYVDELPDPADITLLSKLFNKDYDSYTFTYNYAETGNEQYYIRETDKVMLGGTSLWQIDYEDANVNPDGEGIVTSNLFYYITANNSADEIRIYREYEAENGKEWKYRTYNSTQSASYENYLPMAFTFYEYRSDLMAQWFENVDGVHYKAKDAFLTNIAEILFGVEDGQTYSRIVITTDGENITAVIGEYKFTVTVADQETGQVKQVEITAVIELTWSDFENTTVTLPSATEYIPVNDNEVPEYVDPASGNELTAEQETALIKAFDKTYQSITSSFTSDKGDMYFKYSGLLKLTPTASYIMERELQQYKDWVISDITTKYYCLKIDDTHSTVWQMLGDDGDFFKNVNLEISLTQLATYVPVGDFGFTADMFGYVDGVYVIKPDQMEQFKTKFTAVIQIEGYAKFDVLSFTIKLDDNGNVTEWRLVADCIDGEKQDFYWDLTFNFANFDDTAVTLPDVEFDNLQEITNDQTNEINNAVNADYSNVTIKDSVNNSTMYFIGDDVTVKGLKYDEESGRYLSFTDVYKIDGGNYREVIGGIEQEITKDKFNEYVLNFDFTQIDVSKVKYDTERRAYYISAEDIDEDAFVLYYKGFFDYQDDEGNAVNYKITAFSFTVKDGRVVSVTAYFDNGTMTATTLLSNFGTTTVPQTTPEQGTTEA